MIFDYQWFRFCCQFYVILATEQHHFDELPQDLWNFLVIWLMFILINFYRPGGYTKDPLMSTQYMDLRWSMIWYATAISIGMSLPSEPGKWRSEAFADARLIGKKTAN